MSSTLQEELKSMSLDLYHSYQKSLTFAMERWLPAIGVKNDSQNGYPHVNNIEKHLNSILFSEENRSIHNFILTETEIYILLMSVLLHDIGKYEEMDASNTSKEKHSYFSYDTITEKWAELGIVSKQIADVIALISFSHDYKKDTEKAKDRANDVEKRLNNYMKIEHNGVVRAKAIASLLFLGDHMDGSLSRAVPQLGKAKRGIVGQFRNEVQSVYFDMKNKMLCTSINARSLPEDNDETGKGNETGNDNEVINEAKFYSKDDYERLKKAQRKAEEEAQNDESEKKNPPPFLVEDEGDCKLLINLIHEKKAEKKSFQCGIINTLIRDVAKNNSEIEYIRKVLYEIGMPVLGWFLECSGMLFKVRKPDKIKDDDDFQYFKVERAYEPILTDGFLKTIFLGMVEVSGSSLGDNFHDYETLLNYSREPSSNVHKIKCAVNRLKIIHNSFPEEKSQVIIYCDENFWSLKIDVKDADNGITPPDVKDADKEITPPDVKDADKEITPPDGKDVDKQRTLLKKAYERVFQVSTPPASEPPLSEPPLSEPPASEPPASEAPVSEPPASTQAEQSFIGSEKERKCEKVKYDTQNSVVFSNPLDYLLCSERQHYLRTENFKISKYQIAKLLRRKNCSGNCEDELDECKHLATVLKDKDKDKDKDKVSYLGGLLLSNEKKEDGSGENDIKKMLGEKRFEPGAGNIVITGSYGTGKSTLSFQMASACANNINKGISVYYSLESTRHDTVENYIYKRKDVRSIVEQKIKYFEWYPGKSEEYDKKDSDSLSIRFKEAISDKEGRVHPQMLFPKLTPKNIVDTSSPEFYKSGLFEKRFQEIKYMLSAIDGYNNTLRGEEDDTRVKMVVIDSLNAFADRPLLRGEVHRLFDLFTNYHMLGIFTMEESAQEDFVGVNYIDSIQYRADGVILLRSSNSQSHHESYLEIRKMRNQRHILGEHLFKIRPVKKYDPSIGNIMNREIEIYPSLHYLISATERIEEINSISATESIEKINSLKPYEGVLPLGDKSEIYNIFHIKNFDYILPENIIDRGTKDKGAGYTVPSSQVITITGPSGFYKSDLVINALFAGMVFEKENGLLIRLNDRDLFEEDGVRMSKDLFESFPPKLKKDVSENIKAFVLSRSDDKYDIGSLNTSGYKTRTKTWYIDNDNDNKNTLTELIFTSGALKPEEFIDTVLSVIQEKNIKRVAMIDLKNIGISYPFLINSETSGTMFIPAFVHLMRNHKIHLIMSTSISSVKDSDTEINKACELSDALITIKPGGNESKMTFIESSGNKVDNKRYYMKQDKKLYYCCKINRTENDQNPSFTPKLSPFEIDKYPSQDVEQSTVPSS